MQQNGITHDVSTWGAFFAVFGVIYAIVVGFSLATVPGCYSSLGQTIENGRNAAESIRDFLVYFASGKHDSLFKFRKALGAAGSLLSFSPTLQPEFPHGQWWQRLSLSESFPPTQLARRRSGLTSFATAREVLAKIWPDRSFNCLR